jgi:hypothetical protein
MENKQNIINILQPHIVRDIKGSLRCFENFKRTYKLNVKRFRTFG